MVCAPSLKPIQDMPGVCLATVSDLWMKNADRLGGAHQMVPWDDARRLDFYSYCQYLTTYINVSPAVVYTSLHYIKRYLKSIDSRSWQKTISIYGSEKSVFMAALLLAYKIVEDWGCVDMKYWSQISTIPVGELTRIEMDFLCRVNHRLHMNKIDFVRWVSRCNTDFEQLLYAAAVATSYQQYQAVNMVIDSGKLQSSQYPCYMSPHWYHHNYQGLSYYSNWDRCYCSPLDGVHYHQAHILDNSNYSTHRCHGSSSRRRAARPRRTMTTHHHHPPSQWHWAAAPPLAPSLLMQ